jgi:ABC-2 type transport system permease protein
MSGFRVLLGKELREQVRTYRMPVAAVVFLLFGISSPVLARYTKELLDLLGSQATGGIQIVLPEPTAADAIGQLLKNLGQLGILMAILLAMGSVATEKDRGTAALILTKPASRLAFLLAKLVAISVTLGVSVAVALVFGWIYTVALFDNAALSLGGYVAMAVFLWLTLLAYAGLTLLGSTLTSSAAGGAGFGFVALIVTAIVAALPTISVFMPTALNGPAAELALGLPVQVDLWQPLLGTLLFIFVPFALAWLSFRRQEL